MSDSRREFLRRAGALALSGALMPRSLIAAPARGAGARAGGARIHGMADPHALAAAAVDAARQAGASYADARLSFTNIRTIFPARAGGEAEALGLGVRALVNGYWGFASSPLWTLDEAARLGREAVAQGRANALGKDHPVELGTISPAAGEWTSPARVDPLTVPAGELHDWLDGMAAYASTLQLAAGMALIFTRDERTFASSDGAACHQTLYTTSLTNSVSYQNRRRPVGEVNAQGGWELVTAIPLPELFLRMKEDVDEDMRLPVKPVDVGRYHVLFDQQAVGSLLAQTFGYATELDRALGYEANAGGTSYLNDPLAMLGSYKAGSPLLTVTAERSRPGSLATVKWDDEGVAPEPFTIVKDGDLVDFQTTRESAAWLAPWYARRGVPVRSHGCANAPSAIDAALQHTPNLAMRPAATEASFDTLLAGMSDGIAIRGLGVDMDWQRSSGFALNGTGETYEVKRGRRTAVIAGAGLLFRSTDLWRSLIALGGPKSQEWIGLGVSRKGEPQQATNYTVGAVPAVFRDVTVIDATRKA